MAAWCGLPFTPSEAENGDVLAVQGQEAAAATAMEGPERDFDEKGGGKALMQSAVGMKNGVRKLNTEPEDRATKVLISRCVRPSDAFFLNIFSSFLHVNPFISVHTHRRGELRCRLQQRWVDVFGWRKFHDSGLGDGAWRVHLEN